MSTMQDIKREHKHLKKKINIAARHRRKTPGSIEQFRKSMQRGKLNRNKKH